MPSTSKPSSILFLASSPRGAASFSTKVARTLVEDLRAAHGATVTFRDLEHDPVPHISSELVSALAKAPADRTEAEREALDRSDALVVELLRADVVVVATGMINYGVPSTLKAWIDHVARAGLTFRFTPDGPVGLATGKKVYLVSSKGGIYSEGAMRAKNFVEPYLREVFAFLGMSDLETIEIEGVALGSGSADAAVTRALARAGSLVAVAA